jgi:hypothetical protein
MIPHRRIAGSTCPQVGSCPRRRRIVRPVSAARASFARVGEFCSKHILAIDSELFTRHSAGFPAHRLLALETFPHGIAPR